MFGAKELFTRRKLRGRAAGKLRISGRKLRVFGKNGLNAQNLRLGAKVAPSLSPSNITKGILQIARKSQVLLSA